MKAVTIKYLGDQVIDINISGKSDEVILEKTFAAFNYGSGREHPILLQRKLRSLSVNDLVRVDNRWYQCQSIGWKAITESDVVELETAVINHPAYEEHGAWFALSEIMWEKSRS